MTADIQCIVIGAGVVGLAVARELAQAGVEVLVAESGEGIGIGTSSRNSEVIHAGIYYPAGSLKARLCVQGREQLYAYCQAHGVAHKRLGKLLVATSDDEAATLDGIIAKAKANGVNDLRRLSRQEALELEPDLDCTAAVLSPSTGIVDSHGLMLAYQGDAEHSGTQFVFHCPFERAKILDKGSERTPSLFEVSFGGQDPLTLTCNILINAAGLSAVEVAHGIDGLAPDTIAQAYLCKGSYFTLQSKAPFSHLIYPVPQAAGLGVHLTLDLGGQAKFGPDTEWISEPDYEVDARRGDSFYDAVRRYWPGLPEGSLQPGYAGIRPKISGPADPAADFRISASNEHGVRGLINLYGIESPGLTSSLAIASAVSQLLKH